MLLLLFVGMYNVVQCMHFIVAIKALVYDRCAFKLIVSDKCATYCFPIILISIMYGSDSIMMDSYRDITGSDSILDYSNSIIEGIGSIIDGSDSMLGGADIIMEYCI